MNERNDRTGEQPPAVRPEDDELSVEELDEVAGGHTINNNCVANCGGTLNASEGCGGGAN